MQARAAPVNRMLTNNVLRKAKTKKSPSTVIENLQIHTCLSITLEMLNYVQNISTSLGC